MSPQPKRHHYLPESYLCRFTRGGEPASPFWVYDIEKAELRPQTPHGTGVQRYYYSVTLPDGSRNSDLETAFSVVEGRAGILTSRLERRESLSDSERSELAYFLALLKLRVPLFEAECNQTQEVIARRLIQMLMGDETRAQESMARYEQATGNKVSIGAKELAEFAADKTRYKFVHDRHLSLLQSLQLVNTMAPGFFSLEWTFVHAPPDAAFITTDAPFTITPPPDDEKRPRRWGYGYQTPGTKKVMPLSSKLALVMGDMGTDDIHCDISADGVRDINGRLAADAYRFVIGPDQGALSEIVQQIRQLEIQTSVKWGGSRLVFS